MRSRVSILVAVLVFLAGCSSVQVDIPANDTFSEPNKQLTVKAVGKFGKSKKILVPAVYLHALSQGKYKQSKGGAHAKVTFAVTNLSPEVGTELATAIHADLVQKLENSGWEVLTYSDTRDQSWDKIDTADDHKRLGAPGHGMNRGYGKQYWMTFTPESVPVFEPASLGIPGTPKVHRIYNKIARKVDANVIFPTYRFNAPVPYGETSRGYKKNRAEANVAPALELAFADGGMYSVKAAPVWVQRDEPLRLSNNVGTLTQVSQSTQKDHTLFTWNTFRSIAKGDYAMKLDLDLYQQEVMQAAKDYNSALVAALEPVIREQ
jgi:hypothetical protein